MIVAWGRLFSVPFGVGRGFGQKSYGQKSYFASYD